MGDFYEMFGDEAVEAATTLDIALTTREINGERTQMCCVPVFSAERYVSELESRGYIVSFAGRNIFEREEEQATLTNTEPEQAEQEMSHEELTPNISRPDRVDNTVLYPEIPMSERHNFRITDDNLGHGTPTEKYRANVKAIRMLKSLEAEHRRATPAEQEVLSRYVGCCLLYTSIRQFA